MKTKAWLSRVFTVVYWITLPIFGLGVIAVFGAVRDPTSFQVEGGPAAQWAVLAVMTALPVLIGWRLYVHRRARQRHVESLRVGEFD